MDKVNFIYTEVGTDIILSLSFDEDTEFGIDRFILIRTPKYEFALLPHERGASINWDEEPDVIEIVKEITCISNEITFVSDIRSYQFDISKLSKDEMNELWKTVARMNFDESIKIRRQTK
ncbi:hypothetical protein MYX76_17485 [Desulfobacterota bacterium AH_259_B03_O07]|nr:hypothetical protein [Desulfobacterota bacterium AH_259_B03_O07]